MQRFESSVISYGSQTDTARLRPSRSLRVVLSHMVVKQSIPHNFRSRCLRVVLSHMVVKPGRFRNGNEASLRVVLSHMVVKLLQVS